MKRLSVIILLLCFGWGCGEKQKPASEPFDQEQAIAACEKIISDFQTTLKRELMMAMADGGPENAIAVCRTKAPLVADSFSQMPGMTIRRVSLRQRNAAFKPDSFESVVLETFAAAGTSEPQSHAELTFDSADVRHFRYMKEIKVGGMCLNCHGDPNLFSEALKTALNQYYPDDPAVGYSDGDSRGAFSITMSFPEAARTLELLSGPGSK